MSVAGDSVLVLPRWPEPQPFDEAPERRSYPENALPCAIRGAVSEVYEYVQAPYTMVAAAALAAVSSVAQGLADVKRDNILHGPSSLYFLIIAQSGERKSSCISYFFDPMRQYEADRRKQRDPEVRQYRADCKAWQSESAGLEAAIKAAKKVGKPTSGPADKLASLEESKPVAPRVPRMELQDETTESLLASLVSWPVAAVVSAEAGVVFASHSMRNEKAVAHMARLNQLWDGDRISVGRKTSDDINIDVARLVLALSIQPETLHEFISRHGATARGSGFWARFLMCQPESRMGTRAYKPVPDGLPCLDVFTARLRRLLDQLDVPDTGEFQPHTLTLDAVGHDVWRAAYNDIEADLGPNGELASVNDIAAKAADNIARLAAVFHVFEHGPSGAIQRDSVERATRIVVWHLFEAKRIFESAGVAPEIAQAALMERWLVDNAREDRCDRFRRRQVQQLGPSSLRKPRVFDRVLEELEFRGRIQQTTDGQQKWIDIHPGILAGTVK